MHKITILLFILKLLKLPISLALLSLTAKKFGVEISYNAWLIALSAIVILNLAFWGPVNEVFRAKFILLRETKSEKCAVNYTFSLIFYIFLFSSILTIFIMVFPQVASYIFAPNLAIEAKNSLFQLIRILAPFLLLNQFALILSSILNAYEIFYVPEIASFITQLFNLIIIYFFADSLGVYVLVIGLYISNIILILLLVFTLRKLNLIRYIEICIPNFLGFKTFFIYALPLFFPYLVGQLNNLLEKSLSSGLGISAVSILEYSKRLPETMSAVLMAVITTILLPILTKAFAGKSIKDFDRSFIEVYGIGCFILGMFVTMFLIGGDVIVALFYGGNAISVNNLMEISYLSKLYSISLISIFYYMLFGVVLIATNKIGINAILGTAAQICIIAMNLILIDIYGKRIFPISSFVAHMTVVIYMYYLYPYNKIKIFISTLKYLALFTSCIFFGIRLFKYIEVDLFNKLALDYLISIFYISLYMVLYLFIIGWILKISEIHLFLKLIKVKLRKSV
ncbi:lipid II flippase MurJ [Psychrobacter maritimus]|uniref:lipid II flippase MurJ n=1 Tax=Psychrobacter maritimus TaxID=256325 RepID=UPI00356A6980